MTEAKKPAPRIEDARRIGKKYGMRGAIVFFIDEERFGVASWGVDRPTCRSMGMLADEFYELVARRLEK
jgi:hypothetical protein